MDHAIVPYPSLTRSHACKPRGGGCWHCGWLVAARRTKGKDKGEVNKYDKDGVGDWRSAIGLFRRMTFGIHFKV